MGLNARPVPSRRHWQFNLMTHIGRHRIRTKERHGNPTGLFRLTMVIALVMLLSDGQTTIDRETGQGDLLSLVNAERVARGLKAVSENEALQMAA